MRACECKQKLIVSCFGCHLYILVLCVLIIRCLKHKKPNITFSIDLEFNKKKNVISNNSCAGRRLTL